MKHRPLGITILALLTFVNIALYFVLLTLALFNPPALAATLKALSPGGSGPEIQLGLGRMLPVYYGVSMLLTSAIGLGFWKLWNWTRLVVLAMIAISAVALVVEAPKLFASHSAGGVVLWLFRLALCALFGWYLTCAKVRTAFRGPRNGT